MESFFPQRVSMGTGLAAALEVSVESNGPAGGWGKQREGKEKSCDGSMFWCLGKGESNPCSCRWIGQVNHNVLCRETAAEASAQVAMTAHL